MKIVLATWNEDKKKWLKEGFSENRFNIYTLKDYKYGQVDDIEETGRSCKENARLKAKSIKNDGDSIIIGEDSGLFIESLNGFPGVKTARWMLGSDDVKAEKILQMMDGFKNREAYFLSAMVAILPNGEEIISEAKLNGRISINKRGEYGTGYSSIFELQDKKTIAEVGIKEVSKNDHRRLAIKQLKNKLIKFF